MAPDNNVIHEAAEILLTLAPTIESQLLQGFKRTYTLEYSADKQDVSTEIDHQIGKFIGENIHSRFPQITIDTEEKEERIQRDEYILRIDPVDGSKHMVNHIDIGASLLSLSFQGETLFGLVIQPFAAKKYWAFKNEGAYLNGSHITVNDVSITEGFIMCESPTSYLSTTKPAVFNKSMKLLTEIQRKVFRTRNFGLISTSMAYVAEGACSACIDLSGTTKLYDCEASILIAREAGALVGRIDSEAKALKEIDYDKTSEKKYINDFLIVANPKAYQEIKEIITSVQY